MGRIWDFAKIYTYIWHSLNHIGQKKTSPILTTIKCEPGLRIRLYEL